MSPRRRRPGQFRFEAPRRNRETFGALLVQGLVQSFLLFALGGLLVVSVRMVRAHFLDKYGFQAWILPIIIALMMLFLLYRFSRFWRNFMEEYREGKDARERD